MKTMKRHLGLTAAMAALVLSPAFAAENSKSFGYVGISDVQATLAAAGTMASNFEPGASADSLKVMFGMMLGDPNLSGFGKDAGVVVFMMENERPVGFLEIGKDKLNAYEVALKKMEMQVAKVGDMLMVVKDAADKKAGEAFAAEAKEYLAKPGAAKLDVHLDVAKAEVKYGSKLTESAKEMAKAFEEMDKEADDAMVGKAVVGGTTFVSSIFKQMNTMDLGIELTPENIVVSVGVEAKDGSAMANAMQVSGELNKDMLKKLPYENALSRSVMLHNPKGMEFIIDEAEKACKAAKVGDDKLFATLRDYNKRSSEVFGSNIANMSPIPANFDPKSKDTSEGYTIGEVKDVEKARELTGEIATVVNELVQKWTKDTSVSITMKYEKDAGKIGEAVYDQMQLAVKAGDDDATMDVPVKMTAANGEFMVVTGKADLSKLLALATTPNNNTPAIDAPKLAEGYKVKYMAEVDLVKLAKVGLEEAAKSNKDMKEIVAAAAVPDFTGKITMAAGVKGNGTMSVVNIPVKPIAVIGKYMQEMQAKAAADAAAETSGTETETSETKTE